MILWEDVIVDYYSLQYYKGLQPMQIFTNYEDNVYSFLLKGQTSLYPLVILFHQIQSISVSKTMTSWRLLLKVSIFGQEIITFDIQYKSTQSIPLFIKTIVFYYLNTRKEYLIINKHIKNKAHTSHVTRPNMIINDVNSYKISKAFPTQKQAFDYYHSLSNDSQHYCKLFSYEEPNTGKRRFMIDSINTFPSTYMSLSAKDCHFYEIITENTPCHMYMDIEYLYDNNPNHIDPLPLILYTFSLYLSLLTSIFISPSFTLIITSPHIHKYSKHIIYYLPYNIAFEKNQDMNTLIKHYISIYYELYKSNGFEHSLYACLFAKDKNEELSSVIDPAVYTKNRAMRLVLSRKFSKSSSISNSASLVVNGEMNDIPPSYLLEQSYITITGKKLLYNIINTIPTTYISTSLMNTSLIASSININTNTLSRMTKNSFLETNTYSSLSNNQHTGVNHSFINNLSPTTIGNNNNINNNNNNISLSNLHSTVKGTNANIQVIYEGSMFHSRLSLFFENLLNTRNKHGFIRKCKVTTYTNQSIIPESSQSGRSLQNQYPNRIEPKNKNEIIKTDTNINEHQLSSNNTKKRYSEEFENKSYSLKQIKCSDIDSSTLLLSSNYISVTYIIDLEIGEDRWCENIKREHKSNHIYYEIRFNVDKNMNTQIYNYDTIHGYYCQKCHDYKCLGYHSQFITLSTEILKDTLQIINHL